MELSEVNITLEMPPPSVVFAIWLVVFLRIAIGAENTLILIIHHFLLTGNIILWSLNNCASLALLLAMGLFLQWVVYECLQVCFDRDLAEYVFDPLEWDHHIV